MNTQTRILKFRAWDIAEKRMITHPSLWTMDLNGGLFYGNAKMTKNNDVLNYPIILMQYTGLKDKNGKEIYEGDRIKHPQHSTPLVVQWDYDQWGLFDGICNEASLDEDCEIIGNVWENGELLK